MSAPSTTRVFAGIRFRWHSLTFCLILAVYCVLVFYNITGQPLWNDEGVSYYAAVAGIRETIARISKDTHPPLYYLVLSVWMHLGHGELALRSLSAIASIVTLVLVYFSARVLTGRNIALVAMLLFAVAPANILWAQKARPYALQMMLVALAFLGFVWLLRSATAGDRPIGRGLLSLLRGKPDALTRTDMAWLAYIVGGGLAMLAQHPAGFFVFGCNVVMACIVLRDIRRNRLLLVNWIIAQVLLVAIWLIWLPEFLVQIAEHLTPNQIASGEQQFLITSVWPGFVEFLGVAHFWRLQPAPFVLYMIVVLIGLYRAITTHSAMGWIYLLVASPLLVGIAGFYAIHQLFGYVIFVLYWITVPYCVLLAYGIAAINIRLIRAGLLLLILVINLKGVTNYYAEMPPRLDEIAKAIAANARAGDGFIFDSTGECDYGIAYYLPPDSPVAAALDPWLAGDTTVETAASAAAHARNWVVVPDGYLPAISYTDLERTGTLGFDQRFGNVTVRRYDRRD